MGFEAGSAAWPEQAVGTAIGSSREHFARIDAGPHAAGFASG
jgi:hypothetical protein